MASLFFERISSSSSSSYSFSTHRRKYDVFLSFRSEETRNGFTDHLFEELRRKRIHVFRDEEKLQGGEVVALELIKAIEESQYAIVVLSEKFADSKRCLDELAKIVECREKTGLSIFPVFDHVDPSDVHNQKGPFETVFAKHETDDSVTVEKKQKWMDALRDVSNISGWCLHDRSESSVIQNIVERMHSELYGEFESVSKDLVGMESSIEGVIDLLDKGSDDVRFIGIWGCGGVGKTTLAQVIYCKISNQFDTKSFICFGFVGQTKNDYLVPIQKLLLSNIFAKRELNITSVNEGKKVIKQMLCSRKVLIVLDNVNDKGQLDAIAESRDWFGAGSRLIITSRDKQLLTSYNVDMYEAKTLDNDKALELFSWKAFKQPHPKKDFVDLSNDFVKYAQGLPLFLEVFGSSLHKEGIEVWKIFLDQLNENSGGEIMERLEISYKRILDQKAKELFLDIAFFFKGMDKNRVANILNDPSYWENIDILKKKSLITILGRKIWMHDLLQEMGREIVRREAPQEPGIRSRLWHHKDIFSILKNNTGTTRVEGMMLNCPPNKEDLNANCFSEMTRLRLINICNVLLPHGLNYLSNELQMMEWNDYPLKFMPRNFRPNNLVELIMHHSHIEQLPEEFTNLDQLKLMDLSYSQNLIKTPDFIGFRNLERLIFQGCTRLYKVQPSVVALRWLTLLNLKDCKHLKILPYEIDLESLEIFILSGCSRLKKFSEIGRNMTRLSELYLDGTAVEELPPSSKHLTGLTLLNLKDCNDLLSFPSVICSLTSLEVLTLSGCRGQPRKPLHLLGLSPLASSIGVNLTFKRTILLLIMSFLVLPYNYLSIFVCATLIIRTYCFLNARYPEPEPINLLLPKLFSGLSSLKSLDLSDCNLSDGALPEDLSCLSSLQFLNLGKNNFTFLPDSISQLSKLKLLSLDNCSNLQSLPYLPSSTNFVMARGCTSLENYSKKVVVWTSGETGFTFINCLSLVEEEDKITEVSLLGSLLEDEGSKRTEVSLLDIHFQPLWQRYMEDQIRESEGFCCVLPQSEITEWFKNQNSGSYVSIPLHRHNISLRGIALCVDFEVHKNSNEVSPGQDAKFICRLYMDGASIDPVVYTVPRDKICVGSFGIWLYISHKRIRQVDQCDCIRPLIRTNSADIEIKECGARILYESDVVGFVQHLSQNIFGSPDDLSRPSEDFIKCRDDKVEPSQSNALIEPSPRLRSAPWSLLSRLYEGDHARHHYYDYIFPQIAIPRDWFSCQNLESYINMELPPNLHDNLTWMGFTIFASYTVDKQRAGWSYKQNSSIFLHFYGFSASDEVPLAPYIAFPLSRDVFDESSRRLLVFYIPRARFQLNCSSHIRASFGSDNQVVKVETCGIRIVYEQDVEQFVQTLVQCMLEIPVAYRPSLYQNLLHQLALLQDCNHERGFCSSSLSERSPQTMPKLLPANEIVAEEDCTSPKNQVIAMSSGNSSPFKGTEVIEGIVLDYQGTKVVEDMVLNSPLHKENLNDKAFSTQKACTSLCSSSSSSMSQWKYDVFLSFYGEDTLKNFTDHLYATLIQKGINVYRDNENLKQGKLIASGLMKAIEESLYAIIILSKNYAFSKWCLNELVKILECMKEKGLKVRPIFYHINPSDVGNQRESFEKAFLKHEEDREVRKEQIKEWRTALKEVSKIRGRHLLDSPESEDIEEITKSIFDELNHELSDDSEHLVGINSRVKEMMNLFSTMSDDVRFIGIWGMAGIGKTTLASAIYYRICHQFEASSFIRDIRETVEKDKQGLVNLQKQLLFETLMVKEVNIWNHHDGIKFIKKRLLNKKVLIVLDDVNEEEQLKALAGSPDWFGLGSMIIITSKDKHLLIRHHLGTTICQVNGLDDDEALELFSWTVFKQTYPKKDFEDLSNGFVKYAKRLPIALKVLSSSLIDRPREVWEDYLHQLEEIPEGEILGKLEISYRGLNEIEKNLFLDIACFFKGEDKNRVVHIEGSSCKKNIETLKDKSLIAVLGGKLRMHDLIQEMAWRVVHRESPQEPGRRSRLWLYKDVFHVLKENTGTEVVEGMVLNSPPHEENLNDKAFSTMISLRLLKISNVHLPEGLNFLSNKLRMMEWHDYPLKFMPISFQPDNLVELIMPRSHIKQLPEGFGNLDKLKHMDLSFSRNFIKTPNFIGFRNLETLIFQGCTRLYKVHPSMGTLKRLTFLNLQDCKYLKSLPHEIKLENLKVFILSGCSRLKKLSEFGENMTHLSELYLEETAIEELPSSINHLVGLTILNLKDCKHLSSFPTAICNLTSLEILTLHGFRFQQPKPWHLPGLFPVLSTIGVTLTILRTYCFFYALHGCRFQQPRPWHLPGLFPVLSTIGVTLTVLWTYRFFYAQHPEPEPINLLLPMSFSELRSLKSLDLSDCNLSDGALPDDLSCLSSLQSLNLSKNNFTRLPDSISQLSKLKLLCLDNCSKLQSMPYPPLSTKYVMARGCTSLQNYSNEVDVWTSGDTGFTFIVYHSLPEDDFSLDSLLEDHSSNITEPSLPNIYFKPLWQKSMEDHIRENDDFYVILHRIETLEWFHHQSSTGSFVRIQLPNPNTKWRGIALFVNFEIQRHLNEVSPGQDAVFFHEFTCHLDVDCSVVYEVPKAKIRVGSYGLWLYISQAKFGGLLDGRDFIRPSIEIEIPDVQIKECGARILYEEDVLQFVQHLSQQIFGSPDDFRQRHEDLINFAMGNPQNCNDELESNQSNAQKMPNHEAESCQSIALIDPNHRLRIALKSLLSTLYEVDYAPYHAFDYIFPRIKIPPSGFENQNLGSYVKTDCPPNLHGNSTWMGVAVYAFYTVDEQQAGLSYKQDSIIFVRLFSISSSCEVTLVPFRGFSLSRDIFVDSSPRLLVFYIPRKLFVLNQFSHIWASFESDNRGVKFEMCGIRLIFEQDLEGFIQTLVQCMLEMPDAYHPSLYQNLLVQLAQFQDCDHDTGLCSSSSSERRPRTMPTLLPSIEDVPGEGCNSSPAEIRLGIPFGNGQCESTTSISMLESFFKAHIQRHYDNRGIFNYCFPQSEIPQWYHPQSDGPSVTIPLPKNLYDDPDWMGFAFCAAFQFHKHPTAIRANLGSGSHHHRFICVLDTDIGRSSKLFEYTIDERDVLISLRGREFIWVSFLPSVIFAPQWSQSTWARFWFRSESPDLSARKYCGVNLVFRKNFEDFTRTLVQCAIYWANFLYEKLNSFYEKDVYKMLPIYHDEEISGSHGSDQDIHHQRLPNSQAETSGSIRYSFEEYSFHPYKTGPADFHPFTYYNFCFPPSTIIREWFTHRGLGHSVTIDLPPNLYLDMKWTGLVIYAFFSIQGDPLAILEIMKSGIPHYYYAQFQMSTGDLDDIILAGHCSIPKEVEYLYNLGGFIWISYLPGEQFKDVLQLCGDMEVSFVSDWPGVIVKKCGLRLLYQRDLEQFKQKLKHCEALQSGYQDSHKQFMTAREKQKMQNPVDEHGFGVKVLKFRSPKPSYPLDTDESETQPGEGDFLDFDGCSVCNSYCPPREILYWFSHSSVAPTVTIDMPKDLYGYNDWMGLVLCAYFSCHEDHITDFENFNSEVSHHLICLLETDIGDSEQLLHINSTTCEEFIPLEAEDEFLWLSFIPRWWFQDRLGQSSCLKASIASDWPGLMVHKCGLRFFRLLDEEEFEQIIFRCHVASKNREFNKVNNEVETIRVKDELCENHPHTRDSKYQSQDFDGSLVYNSCFPPSEHLEWFESWSGGPQVTIPLPINLYNDKAWLGLALCASFEVDVNKVVVLEIEDSKTSYNLICNLGAGIKCVEPLHPYRLTRKDLKLLQLGGFIWLYYIPRGSFQDSFNQCSRIDASFETNCPGLTVQKCWFLLLYQHNELEFKETIRRMASFLKEDENPLHKDKGKRVLE